MIDPKLEENYNIILSLFLGIFIGVILLYLHEFPRTIVIDSNEEFTRKSKCDGNLNITNNFLHRQN